AARESGPCFVREGHADLGARFGEGGGISNVSFRSSIMAPPATRSSCSMVRSRVSVSRSRIHDVFPGSAQGIDRRQRTVRRAGPAATAITFRGVAWPRFAALVILFLLLPVCGTIVPMSETETLFAALRQSTEHDVANMLERMVRDAPDHALNRMNALDLARREGLDEERVIAALLN